MESKVPPPGSFNPADVAPLPSAPPPSYDDAMGTSSTFVQPTNQAPFQSLPQPVLPNAANLISAQPVQPQLYPVQQVQCVPLGGTSNRYLPVGRQPLKTTCTGCNTFIKTKTRSKNNCHPTFWCIVLFMTGICIPCSSCPYFCCDKPFRVDHFCPRCNAFLGTYVDAS